MKRFLIAVTAAALAAQLFPSTVQAQSPAQFRVELRERIGNARNQAAANRSRSLLSRAVLGSATQLVAFVRIANAELRRVVVDRQRGRVANTILDTALFAYFRRNGGLDSRYNGALRVVLRSLPRNQKTRPIANLITRSIRNRFTATNRDATQEQLDTIELNVFTNLGLPVS